MAQPGHRRTQDWRRQVGVCGLVACAALSPGMVLSQQQQQSQDVPGGLELSLTFTERLLWDDGDASARSDFGFGLMSETRTQRFALTLDASLDKTASGGLDAEWVEPSATLSYSTQSRNTVLAFDASYRRADADSQVLDDGILVLDEGEREDLRTSLALEFGREALFGGTLRLGYSETNYLDTTSTSLINSDTYTTAVGLRFDIDPRISARLNFDLSDLDREGGIDVRRETLSAGVTLDVTKALVADFDLGHTRVIRTGTVPRDETDGLYYQVALRQEMVNGTLSGSLISNIDENGRRTTARVDRALDLPRASLSFGFGLSRDDDTDKTRPLYAINYSQDLPRGQFSIALDQAFSSTSTGIETLNSRLTLSARQELTSLSVLSGSLSLRESDVLGVADDTTQIDLTLNYAQSLTEDWDLVGGYTHTRRMRDNGNDDIDDVVFIGLRTTLAWRP